MRKGVLAVLAAVLLAGSVTSSQPAAPPRIATDVTNADYRIAAYWSEACAPAGTGPGEMFLGSGLVNLSGGAEDFDLEVLTALPFGGVLTTTATSESGNTSELSECLIVPTDSVFHDSFE